MTSKHYEILKKLDQEFNFLTPKDNFLLIGCRSTGALKYASEVVNEGLVLGVDMEENITKEVREFSKEHDNVKIMGANPLKESTWKEAEFRVQSTLNTLDTQPLKSIQGMENSLEVLVPGGKIATVYTQNNQGLIENFLSSLPLEKTKFIEVEGNLVSFSRRSKRAIF